MMQIEPIAYFRSPFGSKFGIPRQSGLVETLRGEIHFVDKYRRAEALKGLEGFGYLWLIWEFSANRRYKSGEPEAAEQQWQPTVRPPRLGGNATMGVFATRSPFRPNPLGLSSVRLDYVDYDCADGPVVHVLGADLMDGTPIYDIKPYVTYADSHPGAASGFTDTSEWKALDVTIPDDVMRVLRLHLTEDEMESLRKTLSLDPRPHYQKDPTKVYGMPFQFLDIHFVVEGNGLTVVGVSEINS